jgi:hypothetical protein
MKKRSVGGILVVVLVLSVLSISFVSAGWLGNFIDKFFGGETESGLEQALISGSEGELFNYPRLGRPYVCDPNTEAWCNFGEGHLGEHVTIMEGGTGLLVLKNNGTHWYTILDFPLLPRIEFQNIKLAICRGEVGKNALYMGVGKTVFRLDVYVPQFILEQVAKVPPEASSVAYLDCLNNGKVLIHTEVEGGLTPLTYNPITGELESLCSAEATPEPGTPVTLNDDYGLDTCTGTSGGCGSKNCPMIMDITYEGGSKRQIYRHRQGMGGEGACGCEDVKVHMSVPLPGEALCGGAPDGQGMCSGFCYAGTGGCVSKNNTCVCGFN